MKRIRLLTIVAIGITVACGGGATNGEPPPGEETAGCATPQSGWIWCDDFESDRLANYFEFSTDGGSMARVSGVGRDGGWGLRSRFAAGQSDGVFELWIDGVLEASRTGLNWLGSYSAYGLNAIFLESYWNAGSPVAQERYFDDFVVSETRVGCN